MILSMELTDVFSPVEDVISTEMDGEAVLMHISKGKYLSLNETGCLLWKKLGEAEQSLNDLIDLILSEYEVEKERCRADIEGLLNSMMQTGIIEKKS